MGAGATNYTRNAVGNQTGNSAGAKTTYDARGRATGIQHPYSNRGVETADYNGATQVERTRIGGWMFTTSLVGVTSSTQATNHQGSIVGGTDSAGWQTESYGYGPYGEYQYGSGGGTDLIHWRYTGEWLDGTSVSGNGFDKIGLRYDDDMQGRWTQTDPAERVVNPMQPSEAQPYNYAGCNPTNLTDPTGAASQLLGCAAGYIGIAASLGGWLGCAAGVTGLAAGECYPWP